MKTIFFYITGVFFTLFIINSCRIDETLIDTSIDVESIYSTALRIVLNDIKEANDSPVKSFLSKDSICFEFK